MLFAEFKGLSHVLRNSLVEFAKHRIINENVDDKKELLYNYLTSKKFVSQVRIL